MPLLRLLGVFKGLRRGSEQQQTRTYAQQSDVSSHRRFLPLFQGYLKLIALRCPAKEKEHEKQVLASYPGNAGTDRHGDSRQRQSNCPGAQLRAEKKQSTKCVNHKVELCTSSVNADCKTVGWCFGTSRSCGFVPDTKSQ